MNDDLYALWLSQISELSLKKQLLLINAFPFAKAIFNATKYQLDSVKGLSKADIERVLDSQDERYLKEHEDCLAVSGINFICIKNRLFQTFYCCRFKYCTAEAGFNFIRMQFHFIILI